MNYTTQQLWLSGQWDRWSFIVYTLGNEVLCRTSTPEVCKMWSVSVFGWSSAQLGIINNH